MSIISNVANSILDFILPRQCLICNCEITSGLICKNCYDYLPVTTPPVCQGCGRPVQGHDYCHFCKGNKYIDYGRAWLRFVPPVDKIIHHFKYQNKYSLGILFGRAMANIIMHDRLLNCAEILVPVPLFWWKKIRRGYNQTDTIIQVIAENTEKKTLSILRRVKNTRSQTKLNETARRKNVDQAFRAGQNEITDKSVIIIDDVMTTGATINECARILKQAGAKEVYSCVAAITPG